MKRPDMNFIKEQIEIFDIPSSDDSQEMYNYILFLEEQIQFKNATIDLLEMNLKTMNDIIMYMQKNPEKFNLKVEDNIFDKVLEKIKEY